MPIDTTRLMAVVQAGQTVVAAYGALCEEMKVIARLAQDEAIDLNSIAHNITRQIIGAELSIVKSKHIFEQEMLRYQLTHKKNEHAKIGMQRYRARLAGKIAPFDREPGPAVPVRSTYYDEMNKLDFEHNIPKPKVKVRQPSKDVEYDPATQEQIEMAQGLRPIDNPNDDVTAALSVAFGDPTLPADGGASLQFEPSQTIPTAEEQAQALAEALAAETPDEFKPKGLTALEFNGMKLI